MNSQEYSYIVKDLPKSELELEITVPSATLEGHAKKAAVAMSEEIEIDGFRRGKAPYEVVKNKFGEAAVYERAADLAVRESYVGILEELYEKNKNESKDFVPVGPPRITVTKIAPGNDLQYKAKIALLPEVSLADYKSVATKIKKEKKEIVVSNEELDKTMDWIRESRSVSITVDRPAQSGDLVEVDFSARGAAPAVGQGSALGGETRDNGPLITESRNHPVIIGKGNYLPGFEDQLVGMKAGEEKTFTLAVPKDWHDKNMAGRKLDFKLNMKLVQERKVPDLNDEFAKSLGQFASADELKQNIRKGLEQEKGEKEKQRIRVMVIEEIAKNSKMDIPEVLVESEQDKMVGELKSGVENMRMKWEDYLVQIKKSSEDMKKEWRTEAEKRVRIALCLREIARKEKIEVTEQETKEQADRVLGRYGSAKEAEKNIDPDELREYARGIIRNEKVFEILEKF